MSFSKPIKKEDLKLGDQIGSGGFSTVYKATLNGQDVAVKQLHNCDKHEVDVLGTLDHPNIVNFIGALEKNTNLYLVLELCRGGSLRSYLDRKRFDNELLPIYQVYNWAEQTIKPIQYLRAQNLVHKDIKTPNILIADGNVLKLADFGIARKIERTVQNATQSGTAAYGSPELLKDCILSPSYDISAYGVVLWELCTTLVPFEGLDYFQTIWSICHENERPAIPANCPKTLADLMNKCWEVDWKKRPHPDEILQLLSAAEKYTFIAGPWNCEMVFGQQERGKLIAPTTIAINPTNQDVTVLDKTLKKVMVYHSTGEFKIKFNIHPGNGYYDAWDVAVSNDGKYYITNGTQFVYSYNQSGVYKRKWVAASPDQTPLDSKNTRLCGLAIDHTSNLLLVKVTSHKYISKHRLDGTHVSSIKVNFKPYFFSVTTHGTIIISGLRQAQIVDQTGKVLHTLIPPSHLMGILSSYSVCFQEGIIFMCNQLYDQIMCFSVNGDYLGSIPVNIKPYRLTFVPGQKKFLVISYNYGTVQMYSYSQLANRKP